MHSGDALRVRGGAGGRRDQQRGGVGGERAVLGDDLREGGEQLALELEALGGGLDHQLGVGQVRELGRGLQPGLGRRGVLGAPAAALTPRSSWPRSVPGRAPARPRSGSCSSVRAPARQAELGDPGAHRAGARDADHLAGGAAAAALASGGTSALIPVSARPMISFWICEVPSYRVVTRVSRR